MIATLQGRFHGGAVPLGIISPVWVPPEFSLRTFIGVALPLFIVTMAPQNLAGVAVLRANGDEPPISKVIGWSGLANLLVAPFGAFTLNHATITAAFCMGPEAHLECEETRGRLPPLIGQISRTGEALARPCLGRRTLSRLRPCPPRLEPAFFTPAALPNR